MLPNSMIYGEGRALVSFCCYRLSAVYGYAVPTFEFIALFASSSLGMGL